MKNSAEEEPRQFLEAEMENHSSVQSHMVAQAGGSICAPVLNGSTIQGPVTLVYIIHGGQGVSTSSTTQAGASPAAPALTEVQVNSISISSREECTTISLCDGTVTVQIKPRPIGRRLLEEETCSIIRDACQGRKNRNSHPALALMRRLLKQLNHKYRTTFTRLIKQTCLEQQDDSMEVIEKVAVEMFSDGIANWGRIICLVAFGALMCDQLKEAGRQKCVENVAQRISTYLNTHQHQWLVENKAWDGFMEYFREQETKSLALNSLMAFAGLGLGAGLLFNCLNGWS